MTAGAGAGFRPALRSELTKFRTARSQVGMTVALALSFPALAALVAGTGSLQPDDTVLGAVALGGAVVAQLLAGAAFEGGQDEGVSGRKRRGRGWGSRGSRAR